MNEKVSKMPSLVKIIAFFIISIILFVLAFTAPKISLIISAIVFVIWFILFYLEKLFYSRLEIFLTKLSEQFQPQISKNDEDKASVNEHNASIVGIVFIMGILLLAYREWRYKALILFIIPTVFTPTVVLCRAFLGQNTVFFSYIVLVYFFLKLSLSFIWGSLGTNPRTKKLSAFLKIALEAARIIILFISILSTDKCIGFEIPTSIRDSVVATIAIDSIMKEKEIFTKKAVKSHET